ncbi:MAG: 4-hydroxythreonine-4-phosphate dehydrogenase PdxA [Gammaproteobacteria bacterium]
MKDSNSQQQILRIGITQGEPAGCGPDLCIDLLHRLNQSELAIELVYLGDCQLLTTRAQSLNKKINLMPFSLAQKPECRTLGACAAVDLPINAQVSIGTPQKAHQTQVLESLSTGTQMCLANQLQALVTAPVQKSAILQKQPQFTGQTEWIADLCGRQPLMTFYASNAPHKPLIVALATTHLPLQQVPNAITTASVLKAIMHLDSGLKQHFGMATPRISVCGLNPHAGEQGYLGREELERITPAISQAQQAGVQARGPLAADTLFAPQGLEKCDAVLAMYHDQALPVIKFHAFERAVNFTLNLPFPRTSPDHGTALDLAGTGAVDPSSMVEAVHLALKLARGTHHP